MSDLPIELHQLILSHADFLTQIRLRCANKALHAKLEIHDFYNIDDKYLYRLTDDILRSYPFITKLDFRCYHCTNINHLTRLETLSVGTNLPLGNDGISNLVNLKELYINCYSPITNLNHMTKLEFLTVVHSRIDNEGISKLNLRELHILGESKFTDLNHMTRLEKLHASGDCGIGDTGIANLNLKELNAQSNPKITNVNHMTRLEILNADFVCGIDANGISKLKLKKLIAENNPKITKKEPIVPDLHTYATIYNYFRIQEGSAILRYDT